MANDKNFDGIIDPVSEWVDTPMLSDKAVALGGPNGPMNAQAIALTKRTKYLKESADVGANFRKEEYLKQLAINGTDLAGGGFPRNIEENLIASYSGGNAQGNYLRQSSVDLAECTFFPPTEYSTNGMHPNVPWLTMPGGYQTRVIPVDIRTNMYNTPVNIPLFKPVVANMSGFLRYKFIGENPIHTVLKGHLSYIQRIGNTNVHGDSYSGNSLLLGAYDYPLLETGQTAGNRGLGKSLGGIQTPFFIKHFNEFNDYCFPVTQAKIDNALTWPNLYVGSENGFFSANHSTNTEALSTSDNLGPIGPEVKTTKWMDVSQYAPEARRFILHFSGLSKRSRLQWKDAAGAVHYDSRFSDDSSGVRVYRVPYNAKFVRIFYAGRGDNVDDSTIWFRPMGSAISHQSDPLGGVWTQHDIHVCRDIVLWPGATYDLRLLSGGEGFSNRSFGYRFLSGGLSFTFDAGSLKKRLVTKLWDK